MKIDWPDYEVTPTCPCPFQELCRTEIQIGINKAIVAGMALQACRKYEVLAAAFRAETDEDPPRTAAAMWERLQERRGIREEEAA